MGIGRLLDWLVRVCGIIYNFGVFIYHNGPNYIVFGTKLNVCMNTCLYLLHIWSVSDDMLKLVCEQRYGCLVDGHLDLTVYFPNDMWNVYGENKCNMNLILIKL